MHAHLRPVNSKLKQFLITLIYTYNVIWKRNNHFEHRALFPHPTPPSRGAILQFARGRQNPVLGLHPGGMPSWIRRWCPLLCNSRRARHTLQMFADHCGPIQTIPWETINQVQPQGELYPIQTIFNHHSRDQLLEFRTSFYETISTELSLVMVVLQVCGSIIMSSSLNLRERPVRLTYTL